MHGVAGGPAGGNGGNGGNVWAIAEHNLNSLAAFRRRVHWRADAGKVQHHLGSSPRRRSIQSVPHCKQCYPTRSATPSAKTLIPTFQPCLRKAGGGSKCHGADGGDLEVPVPPGTIIRSRDAADGDAPIAELLHPGAAPNPHCKSYAVVGLHLFAWRMWNSMLT